MQSSTQYTVQNTVYTTIGYAELDADPMKTNVFFIPTAGTLNKQPSRDK